MLKHMVSLKIKKEEMKEIAKKLWKSERGEGIAGWITVVCTVLVVGAFVLLPQVRTFAGTIITGLTSWWTNTLSAKIFPTT